MAISEQLDLISKEIGGKLDDNGSIEKQVQEIYDIIKSGTWPSGGGSTYELPTASAETKGGVKIGSGLTMTGEVLSAISHTPDVKRIRLVASDPSEIVVIPENEYFTTLTFNLSSYDLEGYSFCGVNAVQGIFPDDLDSAYALPVLSVQIQNELRILLCRFGELDAYIGTNSYVVDALFVKDV